jgi:hypothetical protein
VADLLLSLGTLTGFLFLHWADAFAVGAGAAAIAAFFGRRLNGGGASGVSDGECAQERDEWNEQDFFHNVFLDPFYSLGRGAVDVS